jgi:hypothetical protein
MDLLTGHRSLDPARGQWAWGLWLAGGSRSAELWRELRQLSTEDRLGCEDCVSVCYHCADIGCSSRQVLMAE